MKKLASVALTFVLFLAFTASICAQTTTIMRPAVAFVKADRSILYIKQPDSTVQAYNLASIISTLGETWNSVHQLAVIGMTPAGDRLIIGATVDFINPSNSEDEVFQGLITLPWPLTAARFTQDTIDFMLSSRNFSTNPSQFRPVGVVHGSQWWATLSSVSDGYDSLTFYHGNTNGIGTIDSTTFQTQLEEGFHMSNIALDTSSNPNTLLAMSFDRLLDADQWSFGRVFLYGWRAAQGDVSGSDITSLFKNLNGNSTNYTGSIDSLFALTVIPVNDGTNAYVGFASSQTRDNTINLFQSPYFGTPSLTPTSLSLPRTIIPTNENFFSGGNCGTYQEFVTAPGLSQAGNSGDVSVNAIGGDSVLFITHESPDACSKRDVGSAIYYYDYSTGAQSATFVYNDSSAQELQPVWVVTPYTTTTVAPVYYPGIAWDPVNAANFGSVDTGNTSSPMTYTFQDTSQEKAVTIDSVTIAGTNASEFTIVSGNGSSTLQPGKSKSVTVTFTPVPPAGPANATLNVYFEGQNAEGTIQYTLTQALSGTVVIPLNGVNQSAALASTMTIEPNPFTSSEWIQLTTPSTGALSIVVHDALGRTVYTSDLRETGAGQTQSFDFDATALGLPGGVYYVTAFLGEQQASRAVVFIR